MAEMDVYVVTDSDRVVGASARLQGAELIRVDEAKRLATTTEPDATRRRARMMGAGMPPQDVERWFYDCMTVTNTTLRDLD